MTRILRFIFKKFGPAIPFRVKVWLSQMDRRFSFLIPENRELVYENYLGNLKVHINTVYPIEREMLTGVYDPTTSLVIRKFLHKGCVALDVGANVGALTMLMAKIVKTGTVYSIEPGPPNYSRLIKNLELNPNIKNCIKPLQIGLSDTNGELFWSEDSQNRGNAGLLKNHGVLVRVITLNELVLRERIERLDFVKIDVEGTEYEVIKGGISSLQKLRPAIYYETLEPFRQARGFDIFGEIEKMLKPIDYELFEVDISGEIYSLNKTNELPPNTLALHKEKIKRFI